MDNSIDEKPLTVKDVREVLIPAMEEVFATKKDLENFATKKDLDRFATKQDLQYLEESLKAEMKENFVGRPEFQEFKNSVLTSLDKILKNLDILMAEKEVSYFQKKKERKLWEIMIDALQKHQILSQEQIQEIKALEIF